MAPSGGTINGRSGLLRPEEAGGQAAAPGGGRRLQPVAVLGTVEEPVDLAACQPQPSPSTKLPRLMSSMVSAIFDQGATTAKERALETLAHDIRTPLGAIEGYCEILQEGIQMAGMPAFGPTHTPEELWEIVAFVEHLPEMAPERYEALTAPATPDSSSAATPRASDGHDHVH